MSKRLETCQNNMTINYTSHTFMTEASLPRMALVTTS